MTKRKILLATFLNEDNINWFLEYLNIHYGIKKDNCFIYNIKDTDDYIVTFFLFTKGKINLKNFKFNTIIVHFKKGCIYTINSLNKLIEKDSGMSEGNIVYSEYIIDWSKYKDKIILLSDKELFIYDIDRIFFN